MRESELPEKVRTIFLSDLHLGYRISQGERCLSVLENVQAEMVYLVGDIVDEVRLRNAWHWPESHQRMLERIFKLKDSGAKVFFSPGNHDVCFRDVDPLKDTPSELKSLLMLLMEFETADRIAHLTVDGRKFLVTHGDLYDETDSRLSAVRTWGAKLFDRYNGLLPRRAVILTRAFFKLILARPSQIQQQVCEDAIGGGFDGVIFGHLHEPKLLHQQGLVVGNCGDWVVNESFLVETLDGKLQLFNFGKLVGQI